MASGYDSREAYQTRNHAASGGRFIDHGREIDLWKQELAEGQIVERDQGENVSADQIAHSAASCIHYNAHRQAQAGANCGEARDVGWQFSTDEQAGNEQAQQTQGASEWLRLGDEIVLGFL